MNQSTSAPNTSDSTSVSLLARVKQQDSAAWERFVRLYGPLIYRWCRQTRLQPSDAADVVQNVLQAVNSGIGGFRNNSGSGAFRAWLWTVTRNKVRDHFRGQAGEPTVIGGSEANQQIQQLPDLPDAEPDPGFNSTASIAYRALEMLKTEFETRTWDAFWRATVEREKAAVIAADMEMSVHAVYQAKSRVLRRVRQELDGLCE